jgi:hypothetical protein
MKKITLLAAVSLVAWAQPAQAQKCPAASVGQSCATGVDFVGWWGTGLCVASTCGTTAADGAATVQPCGFCEPIACPMAQIGQPCEAGTCTQATCLVVHDAGSGSREPCSVCASPPPDQCSMSEVGQSCGDGGVCMANRTRTYGPAGAPPPSQVTYPVWQCVVPSYSDADVDAASSLGLAAGDDSGATEALPDSGGSKAPPGSSAATGSGSSGCGISAAGGGAGAGLSLLASVALTVVSLRRRRRRSDL